MSKKVVLAYSGGLDTSIIIPWLNENYGMDVIAMIADVGQGEDLDAVVAKAYATGAKKAVVLDLRDEFVRDYVYPTVRAGAIYEHKYLLGTSIARPVIAKHQVEVALQEGAEAVAHGCTGKGNDQVRFEHAYQALAPDLKVIAPWREWTLKSREDCLDYAEAHGIPVAASREKIHSRDRNLWHISHEGGELENAGNAPLPTTWVMTRSPQEAPDREEVVEIGFVEGRPVSVDGMALEPVQIVELLNEIGARNAIGRIDLVENRFVGIKSRGLYETPGGTLITTAHRELEALTLDREVMHYKQQVALKYAELVYFGLWFTPLREALDAFVDNTQKLVTGSVKLSLYKGNIGVAGRHSPYSLYSDDLSSFTMGDSYDQKDAKGFIQILGLPARTRARLLQKKEAAPVKMWSGRFREPLDQDFEQWQRSLAFDWQLLPQEVAASKAHARTIAAAGILTPDGAKQDRGRARCHSRRVCSAAAQRRLRLHASGRHSPLCGARAGGAHRRPRLQAAHRSQPQRTDCHRPPPFRARKVRLDRRPAGGLGTRAHRPGRGRRRCGHARLHPSAARRASARRPLAAGLCRDAAARPSRLEDASRRLNYCPLGSGAVAGATLKLDRTIAARELGFRAPTANSMDATSDRDFALEFLQALTLIALHASRFAEEITLYATAEFGFVELPEAFSTGSSAMPQKKNPDLTELVRAKVARINGAAQTVTMLLKGLPLAYNKDLQESQEPLFAAADTAERMTALLARFTAALRFNTARMRTACETGYLNAMAAATYLVHKGVPFRKAHEKIGLAVRYGLEKGCELDGLTLEELKQFGPEFESDFFSSITLDATVNCHDVIGGTAVGRVREALAAQEARLSAAMGQMDGNT